MPWKFSQATGNLTDPAGIMYMGGWSGHGIGKNNPSAERLKSVGVLPRGGYTIGEKFDHPHLGKCVMRLIPDIENEMYGRDSFLIHGAAFDKPETEINETENSSDGCIIEPLRVRKLIAASTDKRLIVY